MYNSARTNPELFPMRFDEMDLLLNETPLATSPPANLHPPHQANLNGYGYGYGYPYRRMPLPQPSDHRYSLYDIYRPRPNGSVSPDPSSGSGTRSPASPDRDTEINDLLNRLRSIHLREPGFGSVPDPYQTYHYQRANGFYPNRAYPDIRFGSRPVRGEESFILQGQHYRNPHYFDPSPIPAPVPLSRYEMARRDDEYIYRLAKQQNGCRFLQKKFDEGTRKEIESIFYGLIDHMVELMMDPFGNYLIQKLLEVCTQEQRLKVVIVITRNVVKLIRVCLNNHGTRAMQKLIETLKTPQQIGLVVAALKPGFLDLIKDLNGNHVIQRCLQCLPNADNKFIFDASAKHCVDIATHQHGCCVLQRCINYSTGEHRAKLVREISANGLHLAQDPFGNYVVQYTLALKNPLANANFAVQFQGNYVNLSTQKFSSNVVEKCLKTWSEKNQANVVLELLAFPRFEQLLQDPYANYVIQRALENTKGALNSALREAIRPHAAILPTSPYSKKLAKIA